MAYNNIRIRQVNASSGIITSGTLVVGRPTGTNLPLDTTASLFSFSQVSYPSILFALIIISHIPYDTKPLPLRLSPAHHVPKPIPSTSAPLSTSATPSPTDINSPTSVEQPIPVRTLVAICVAAFILVAGLVIFVLWFGARARKNKLGEKIGSNSGLDGNINGLDYMKNNLGGTDGTTGGTTDEVHLKGFPANSTSHAHSGGPPLKGGLTSEHSSYYSQQTMVRNPSQTVTQYNAQHAHRPTADSFERQQPVYTIPANYSATSNTTYANEPSFLPKQNVYNRNDMAPVSPRSANIAMAARPPPHSDTTSQSSPRSQSAQAIVRPYAVGAHPYTSSHIRTASIEHQGNYTVATALPEPETVGLGLNGHYYSNLQNSAYASSPSTINGTFAKAGARPGYDAYGIEPKQPPTHSPWRSDSTTPQPYSQQAGRQPIQSLSAHPSLESIRSIARKASIDQTAAEVAADFVFGGQQAVGTTSRSRNNSMESSVKGRGVVAGSQYSGSAPGYTASVYSARSGKEGRGGKGDKEKISKSEKKREMEAMDNLIAALDESAMRERRRKEALAEAAGLGSAITPNGNGNTNGYGRRSAAKGEESDSPVVPRRRKDVAITGSYPLPSADVFRAALSSAGRGRGPEVDDEIDDEEIERWRRR